MCSKVHCTSFQTRFLPCEDCLIILFCHSMGTSLLEIALLDSSFAGSPQCAFTLIRNVAVPIVVPCQSSSIASHKMSASNAPTSVAFAHSPTHLFTAFSSAWLSHKSSMGLSHGCRIMPKQRSLA